MKLMLAYCDLAGSSDPPAPLAGVQELLRANSFQVQDLNLPPIDDTNPLRSLASWRLLPIGGMADVLLCLDAQSAVLNHPRKHVWLLSGGDQIGVGGPDASYSHNVLVAGIGEAVSLFAPSDAVGQLASVGLKQAKRLDRDAVQLSKTRHAPKAKGLLKALRG